MPQDYCWNPGKNEKEQDRQDAEHHTGYGFAVGRGLPGVGLRQVPISLLLWGQACPGFHVGVAKRCRLRHIRQRRIRCCSALRTNCVPIGYGAAAFETRHSCIPLGQPSNRHGAGWLRGKSEAYMITHLAWPSSVVTEVKSGGPNFDRTNESEVEQKLFPPLVDVIGVATIT